MRYEYFNSYPTVGDNLLITDQTTFKQMIKEFDTAMKHVGLVRATVPNQLDVDNIPNLNVDGIVKNTSTYVVDLTSVASNKIYVEHLPLVYCFTDAAQTQLPIYIYFYFRLYTQTYVYDTAPKIFIPQVRVDVSTSTTLNVNNSMSWFTRAFISSSSSSTLTTSSKCIDSTNKVNSYINYNAEKGWLYINLLPKTLWQNNMNLTTDLTFYQQSLVRLLIKRNLSKDTIAIITPDTGIQAVTSFSTAYFYGTNIQYINANGVLKDTTYSSVSTFASQYTTNKDGKVLLSPFQMIDINNTPSYDPDILIVQNKYINPNTSYMVDVNGEKRYLSYSSAETPQWFTTAALKYASNVYNAVSLLIWDGD